MRFDSNHYVPFLKGKMGEYTALSKLSEEAMAGLTPLIDIPPISAHAAKPIDTHLAAHAGRLAKNWGTDEPLFVDLHDMPLDSRLPSGKHHVEHLHALLREEGVQAIPVTGLDRDGNYHDAVRKALKPMRQVAVRLLPEDLETPSLLETELGGLTEVLGVARGAVHLMLDLRSLQTTAGVSQVVATCRQSMNALEALDAYASLTVSGSSMPQSLSELVGANDSGRIPRLEVEVWTRLQGGRARKPSFGDYGAVHPDLLDLDPRKITIAADIRYTCPADMLVLRGSSTKHHPLGYGQYHNLALALVKLPDYQGRAFSWGDNAIYQRAHRLAGSGNKTTWVQIATNHHLELVTISLRRTSEAA